MAHPLYSILAQQGSRISGWVWVIIFILVALLVWWLLTRATGEDAEIEAHAGEHAEEHPAEPIEQLKAEVVEAAAVEPPPPAVALEAPVAAPEPPAPPAEPLGPDDLTKLEGIGPKVNGVLQAAGISTFTQLAAVDVVHLKQVLENAGYPYMDPGSWPEQAKLLAEGNLEAFEKLTAALKGGRKVA
jgi:predicted flap endonuclease-1-like 5' DNA nuclease